MKIKTKYILLTLTVLLGLIGAILLDSEGNGWTGTFVLITGVVGSIICTVYILESINK